MNDVIKLISNSKYCCNSHFTCVSVFMLANDLMLMSHSVTVLHKLFNIVEEELIALIMSINPSKSSCIRFDPRYDAMCASIITHDGSAISSVKNNLVW